jgi:CheY-like chemotaxis protein
MTAAGRVLVVDDDDTLREFVMSVLSDEGYEVAGATNGAVALEIAGRITPDVVLLDMRMPVMDGATFATTYRRVAGQHAPILVMTGVEALVEPAFASGAGGVIKKPFDVDTLLSLVAHFARTRTRVATLEPETGLAAASPSVTPAAVLPAAATPAGAAPAGTIADRREALAQLHQSLTFLVHEYRQQYANTAVDAEHGPGATAAGEGAEHADSPGALPREVWQPDFWSLQQAFLQLDSQPAPSTRP